MKKGKAADMVLHTIAAAVLSALIWADLPMQAIIFVISYAYLMHLKREAGNASKAAKNINQSRRRPR